MSESSATLELPMYGYIDHIDDTSVRFDAINASDFETKPLDGFGAFLVLYPASEFHLDKEEGDWVLLTAGTVKSTYCFADDLDENAPWLPVDLALEELDEGTVGRLKAAMKLAPLTALDDPLAQFGKAIGEPDEAELKKQGELDLERLKRSLPKLRAFLESFSAEKHINGAWDAEPLPESGPIVDDVLEAALGKDEYMTPWHIARVYETAYLISHHEDHGDEEEGYLPVARCAACHIIPERIPRLLTRWLGNMMTADQEALDEAFEHPPDDGYEQFWDIVTAAQKRQFTKYADVVWDLLTE